jgi:putative ABC transport system permease protein
VTLLCGVAPALRSARGGGLAHGGRAQVSTRHAVQWSFVGVQVALSVVLLAGAGLLMRSFQELGRVDAGFDARRVLTFRLSGTYGDNRGQLGTDVEALLGELALLPGVEAVATSSPVPGVLNDRSGFEIGSTDYRLADASDDEPPLHSEFRIVSASYFPTMRIAMLAGDVCRRRPLAETQEIVVNQAFVSRYLGARSPLGLNLRGGFAGASRIVGVARDARDFGLDREPTPTAYSCATAIAFPPLAFLVRTRADSDAILGAIRLRLKELAPQRSVYDVQPLEERIGAEFAQERLRTALLVMFAGGALSLVCLGIYGTLSYIVSLRRREVGLRVALGALSSSIVGQFVWKALRVVAVAGAVGLALALALGRALAGMLFDVSPFDPVTLAGVAVLVPIVAALAAFLPALRAARIDPMEALREE